MPDQDPIQEFIALPRDQQLSTLQSLSPDKQEKLLGKVKEYRAKSKAAPPASSTTPTPEPSAASRFLSSAIAPIKGAIQSLSGNPTPEEKAQGLTSVYDVAMRPLERVVEAQGGQVTEAEDLAKQGRYSEAAGHAVASVVPLLGPWVADAAQEYYDQLNRGDVAGALGTAAGNTAMAFAPEAGGKFTRGLRDTAAKAREGMRTTAQSLTGAGERPVKAEVAKQAAAAKTADEAHQAAVEDALHETQGKELEHQRKVKEATEAAKAKGEELTRKQIEEREQAAHERVLAEEKLARDREQQKRIAPLKEKATQAWQDLRARVETAREKALKTGNEKYNTVNAALNPFQADPEVMAGAIADAVESLKGSHADPTLLKNVTAKLERGDPWTYEDLQGDYSRLGRELSKGTLPGDEFHAYDVLHEAIGDEMQRIADEHGAGAQLNAARDYWRLMKQTFGRDTLRQDVATSAVKGAAPDVAKADAEANQMRLFGAFAPQIPRMFEHVQNIQKGIDALPEPTPDRALVKNAKLPTVPPRTGPAKVEAKLPEPPVRTPVPDRPETPTVDTRAIRERLIDKWATGENTLSKWQVRALATGGLSALVDIAEIIGGRAPGAGQMAAEAAGTAAFTLGPAMMAKLLENPGVREWITRPPAGELNTLMALPDADRLALTDGLRQVVGKAVSKGWKVDPTLAASLGVAIAAKGPHARKLQQTADQYRRTGAVQ